MVNNQKSGFYVFTFISDLALFNGKQISIIPMINNKNTIFYVYEKITYFKKLLKSSFDITKYYTTNDTFNDCEYNYDDNNESDNNESENDEFKYNEFEGDSLPYPPVSKSKLDQELDDYVSQDPRKYIAVSSSNRVISPQPTIIDRKTISPQRIWQTINKQNINKQTINK